MVITLDEGKVHFTFPGSWEIVKFDDHRDFRRGLQAVKISSRPGNDAKAVDGLLFEKSVGVVLLEIRDFRGHMPENKSQIGSALASEVALKCAGTVAGVIGCYRTSSETSTWTSFVRTLCDTSAQVKIVFWLETDRTFRNPQELDRHKARMSILTKELKVKCRWLTHKAFVLCQETWNNDFPGAQISITR